MTPPLLKKITKIVDETDDMTIATIRPDGFPQATTVSYVNDGLAIYFGTSSNSQKAQNITANGKVSLTINRPYANWDEITGLSLAGNATLVTDAEESKKAMELVFSKFPQVADYMPANSEEGGLAIFRIDPLVISLLDYGKGFGHIDLVEV